jgi:hypothetical protein
VVDGRAASGGYTVKERVERGCTLWNSLPRRAIVRKKFRKPVGDTIYFVLGGTIMDKTTLRHLVKEEMQKMLQQEMRLDEENFLEFHSIDHLTQAFFSLGFLASYTDKMDLSRVQEMANELKDAKDVAKAKKALSKGATVLGVRDDYDD